MTATHQGVDDGDVSETQSVIDLTDNNLFLSGLPMSINQEIVNEDSVNHISDGGVHFPGQQQLMRIWLTILQMEEWIHLMTPQRRRRLLGWKKQDPKGDVSALDAG